MSEMIERVARAIWDKHICEYCTPRRADPLSADCCAVLAARAAIEAMREPTEAMSDVAMQLRNDGKTGRLGTYEVWRAMIDAALTKPSAAAPKSTP